MPSATVTVDAPIADVFALLADLTTHPTWSPDVLSARQITDAPLGVGTRFRNEIRGVGESEVEVTEYEEPTRVEFLGHPNMGDVRHLFTLTSQGERTRVDQVLEMRLSGLRSLLGPVMAVMMKRGARRNAAGLEHHFRSGANPETGS